MADLTITAANVVKGSGANVVHGTALAAVTAGQVVYQDTATGKYGLADSNSVTAGIRNPVGIALHAAAANQPLAVMTSGAVTIGAALTASLTYYLSDTPGGICPVADVGAGEYSIIIGMAASTTVLNVDIQASGAAA